MRISRAPRLARKGVTVVETALVLSLAFLFLFGIFEYSRFFFLLQIMNNAAREGARYAVSRTADGTTSTDVTNYVTTQLAGRQAELANMTIDLQNVTPNNGLPVPSTSWNDAPFGGAILVRITGDYKPILPVFLFTSPTIQLKATSMMSSEAN